MGCSEFETLRVITLFGTFEVGGARPGELDFYTVSACQYALIAKLFNRIGLYYSSLDNRLNLAHPTNLDIITV